MIEIIKVKKKVTTIKIIIKLIKIIHQKTIKMIKTKAGQNKALIKDKRLIKYI